MFNVFKKMEFGKKMIGALLIVSLVPFLCIGLISDYESNRIITNEINNKVRLLALQKEETLRIWMDNVLKNAMILADTSDVYDSFIILKESILNMYTAEWFEKRDYFNERRDFLDGLMQKVHERYGWSMSFLINKEGKAVYSSQRSLEGWI